ncbi:MAG: class I SAM-dependent methyltransferase [Inquilinus sp.]|nr:class I SAM-dependent methyltransferase [Inquilinus sp.]
MANPVERLAYAAAQTARVGWYFGQYFVSARLARGSMPRPKISGATPRTQAILAELRALMLRDWRNIEAGLYRLPHNLVEPPHRALADARAYFRDLPKVNDRRRARGNAEVFRTPPAGTPKLPRYYLQNFHYQTDGYLSDRSARLYEHQVEVLFGGGADAMRRQALVPIHHYVKHRVPENVRLLDLACGTGPMLAAVRDNHPRLELTGIDLSAPYLAEARRRVGRGRGPLRALREGRGRPVRYVQAAAEAIPLPDASQDLVTCVYLFHELPRKVRAQAAAEIARVLKPGGQFVFLDSLQAHDRPDFAGLLEYFPQAFHEPYYADYVKCDLAGLFGKAGLDLAASDLVFMSKLLVFEKPS